MLSRGTTTLRGSVHADAWFARSIARTRSRCGPAPGSERRTDDVVTRVVAHADAPGERRDTSTYATPDPGEGSEYDSPIDAVESVEASVTYAGALVMAAVGACGGFSVHDDPARPASDVEPSTTGTNDSETVADEARFAACTAKSKRPSPPGTVAADSAAGRVDVSQRDERSRDARPSGYVDSDTCDGDHDSQPRLRATNAADACCPPSRVRPGDVRG